MKKTIDVEKKLREILTEITGIKGKEIRLICSLQDDLWVESIDYLKTNYPHVNWNGFENNPTDAELRRRENFESLVKYVKMKLGD